MLRWDNSHNNYNDYNIIILIYFPRDFPCMVCTSYTPVSYTLMLSRFRDGVDLLADPENAFVDGTPQWMIDEWVRFARESGL